MFTHLSYSLHIVLVPYSSHIAPTMTVRDTTTVSQTGPMITDGAYKAQGSKAKPASRVSTTQSKQSEGQSNTNGVL
jgi:hypothetical protein